MISKVRSDDTSDAHVQQILEVLDKYRFDHPQAQIDAYRRNPASIRIRIIDPDFQGIDRLRREDPVWPLLEELPEEVRAEISMLVLLTPEERSTSFANLEFENPVPSLL